MKYIATWSGGKDSTATVILAHEHNEPLDEIVFCEVMYDETISGELPEHINFIRNIAKPMFESWGYKVTIVHSDKNYMTCFNHIVMRSKKPERIGKKKGLVMRGHCDVLRDCKLRGIKQWEKEIGEHVEYIGIAKDEPRRLERLVDNQISLLNKYKLTEKDAYELCEKYGLLSPIYSFAPRGGCWFCPNAKDNELRYLRKEHPDLWQRLLGLEEIPNVIGNIWDTLTHTSIHDKEEKFKKEDLQ